MLVLIRHGETRANKERRYLGKTDEPLSEEGIEKLEAYKRQKRYPDVEDLFSSPMKRCVDSAKIIYPMLCPVRIPAWKEMDFGQFEYRNYEELKTNMFYQEYIDSGGALPFPGGESREAFIRRCKNGFFCMCGELRETAGRRHSRPPAVGMVVHGGTIMALLSAYAGGAYFDYQASNGGGYICRLTGVNAGKNVQEDKIKIEVVAKL
ncbi:MAG: histidine phosphatase family protein [Muribaculaceae bacterium]|nr:histidine phosphatase family protein [Muribaculaceae bacterium]MCM1493592.1 histidine phosphatase family protein [Muribaculaceae bacterium]